MTATTETPLLKPEDVAKALNVSKATIYRWSLVEGHALKFVRFAGNLRVHPDDLAAFVEDSRS